MQAGFDAFPHLGHMESENQARDCEVGVGQGESGGYCQRAGGRGG